MLSCSFLQDAFGSFVVYGHFSDILELDGDLQVVNGGGNRSTREKNTSNCLT